MLNIERSAIEKKEDWMRWAQEIPPVHFDSSWDVKVIPPFGGAMARFWISKGANHVSVYLDVFDRLGSYGEPYWEIYPYQDDVCRIPMADVAELEEKIAEVLNQNQGEKS